MSEPFLDAEGFDEQAHRLYDAGEYDEALDLLREGLSRYPDSADLHAGLGYVRLAREEYAWAHRSFSRALEIDAEHEDGWVGLGEAHLKFGRINDALSCFAMVEELGLGEDRDLGLAVSRALYREGLYHESRERLAALARVHRDSAEVRAALGYTLHALGDEPGAGRELRAAVRLDPELHEVRIYLAHLLFERGETESALREMERVPPEEHWDPLSLWRFIELKCTLEGCDEECEELAPWRERWEELQAEPDDVDDLLAEVEAAFEEEDAEEILSPPPSEVHRVRTTDGRLYTGSWDEILLSMRDELSDRNEPLSVFMHRAAQRVRRLTGCELPCDDAEAFLRESARIGLVRIEG